MRSEEMRLARGNLCKLFLNLRPLLYSIVRHDFEKHDLSKAVVMRLDILGYGNRYAASGDLLPGKRYLERDVSLYLTGRQ
jgi:hypothetical protein